MAWHSVSHHHPRKERHRAGEHSTAFTKQTATPPARISLRPSSAPLLCPQEPVLAPAPMPHHHRGGEGDEQAGSAASPRPSSAGCYAFLTRSASSRRARAGGYRRLDSAPARKGSDADTEADTAVRVRVEVGTAAAGKERSVSVFHVDPAVLDAGPVRRLVAAAGRRLAGGGVAVAVDALLFEHLLWLATTDSSNEDAAGEGSGTGCDDLSEIVEFYSQDDDDDEDHRFKC